MCEAKGWNRLFFGKVTGQIVLWLFEDCAVEGTAGSDPLIGRAICYIGTARISFNWIECLNPNGFLFYDIYKCLQ